MKKRLAWLTTCLLSIIILSSAFADDDWLAAVLVKLNRLRVDYPQEKVHLQLDKPYYSVGDDVWFKAYVVNTESNELSAISSVLYIDLIDDQDSVRKTMVLPLANGLGSGDFRITDSLFNAGTYHIKAYTRWMQNYNSDFIFNKDIKIGDARTSTNVIADAKFTFDQQSKVNSQVTFLNLDKTPVANKAVTYKLISKGKTIGSGKGVTDNAGKLTFINSLKEEYKTGDVYLQAAVTISPNNIINRTFAVYNASGKIDVQFFPEGGRLVNGLKSKVGFKAVKPGGYSVNVTGYVVDQANQHVAEFSAEHAGMGIFALQPIAGNKYTAVITEASGAETRYPMPVAENEGYVLGINHTSGDSLTVRVTTSKSLVTGKEVALVAQQNGVVKYATKITVDQQAIVTRLAEKRFNTGLIQFTLLAADGAPIAERLLFINHNDQLKVDVSANKKAYSKREKVDLDLTVKDNSGKPVQGNFSVAVTDVNKVGVDEDDDISIYANLLLTSDLKGFIEKPNYYFNTANQDRIRHLDHLLLTQGWRRFSWADLKANKFQEITYKAQNSLGLSGRITTIGNKPVPNGKVTLYGSTPNGPIMLDTVADANGNFVINGLDFNDDVKFVVRAKNAKDRSNVKILLNKPSRPIFTTYTARDGSLSTSLIDYLKSTQKRFDQFKDGVPGKTIMLNEVNIRDKRIDKNKVKGSSRIGSGTADIVVRKEKIGTYPNLLYAFYGLAGIEVKNDMVYRIGRTTSITRPAGVPMAVSMNGVMIQPEMLKDIPPGDVEAIEILKSGGNTAIYGDAGYWGVIEITMKSGAPDGSNGSSTYLDRITVKGFSAEREFYSPAYDKPDDRHAEPDLRSTIYWQPNVVTDANGKARVTYFTADDPGTYRVVTEGLDLNGKLARQTYMITVK